MNAETAHQWQLKEKLPHTWEALLARFGRFTAIQSQAIEPLLAGKNCVLVSATASGKTEAALAPLLELHKQHKQSTSKLSLLYLVPTRALSRDLARRLQEPLGKLAVRMQIKTSDEPALKSNRPPELLLTTPESLDSLLANHPRLLKDVRVVVIDELHILDNTPRGDQLMILLNRLRRLRSYAFARGDVTSDVVQYCALSATINDPATVAARYFSDPQVIQVGGQRAIDAELIALDDAETLRALFATLKQRGCKKVLAFCTSRAECEEWAHRVRDGSPFGERIYVHHASLAASVRHAVESSFAQADAALCFATSTLELGIDIGDVDLVLLLGAPGNTSAFLQRIGRGSRRTSRTAVVCCYRHAMEHALFRVFIRAAQTGADQPSSLWPPAPGPHYFFRPSIVVQQLCSYLKQTRLGEIEPDSAYQLFATPQGAPLIARTEFDQIIEHLTLKRYFEPSRGSALKPGKTWSELDELRAIYTNLVDVGRKPVAVIDEETGRQIGELSRAVSPGGAFLFGGQSRQARRFVKGRLIVRTAEREAEAAVSQWRAPWRPMSAALAEAVAAELGVPRAVNASDMAMLIEEQAAESENREPETVWLFHCAGEAYGLILGDLLEKLFGVRVEDHSELSLLVKGIPSSSLLHFTPQQVRARVRQRWQQMESWFDPGSFQNQLPLDVRRASVIEAFDVDGFIRTFAGRRLAEAVPPV